MPILLGQMMALPQSEYHWSWGLRLSTKAAVHLMMTMSKILTLMESILSAVERLTSIEFRPCSLSLVKLLIVVIKRDKKSSIPTTQKPNNDRLAAHLLSLKSMSFDSVTPV